MRQYAWLLSFVTAILCTACAPLDSDLVDWDHGARAGTVLELLTPQAAKALLASCWPGNAALPEGREYIRVRYRAVRLHHKVVASAPADLRLRPGDRVELWPGDCEAGQITRVGRVLGSPSSR